MYALTLVLAGYCTVSTAVEGKYSAEAMREFTQAQKEYHTHAQDSAAAWHFGRACFDLAEFATNKTERADIAQQGIAASRRAVEKDTNSAPAHYYLGLNLGQLARTRSLGALKLVGEMEREFLRARELDSHFDYAGADRTLGLLYRDAPSIGSVGSRTKAHQRLQQAVDLAPDYPENRLNLVEAYLKWGDRNSARRELKQLEADLPRSQNDFPGARWEGAWADWDERLTKARRALDLPAKVESPKQRE
jgi:tetratricopeptide (TPR) repeat protein